VGPLSCVPSKLFFAPGGDTLPPGDLFFFGGFPPPAKKKEGAHLFPSGGTWNQSPQGSWFGPRTMTPSEGSLPFFPCWGPCFFIAWIVLFPLYGWEVMRPPFFTRSMTFFSTSDDRRLVLEMGPCRDLVLSLPAYIDPPKLGK